MQQPEPDARMMTQGLAREAVLLLHALTGLGKKCNRDLTRPR